jgi:hypothetical protein
MVGAFILQARPDLKEEEISLALSNIQQCLEQVD